MIDFIQPTKYYLKDNGADEAFLLGRRLCFRRSLLGDEKVHLHRDQLKAHAPHRDLEDEHVSRCHVRV
jgi:hypothetical protein